MAWRTEFSPSLESMQTLIASSIFRLYRIMTRFPHVDKPELLQIIDRLKGGERLALELEYQSTIKRTEGNFPFIAMALSALGALKCYLVISRTSSLLNSSSQNSKSIDADGKILTHYSCMITNCSQLSPVGTIIENMSHLPVLIVCDPLAPLLENPIVYSDRICLLLFSFLAFGFIMNGIIIPAIQLMMSYKNGSWLWIQAPLLAISSINEQKKSVIEKILQVYNHHYQNLQKHISSRTYMSEQSEQSHLARLFAAADYTTIVRSDWFRAKLICLTSVLVLCSAVSSVAMFYLTLGPILGAELAKKANLFREFDAEMRRQNCIIWTSDRSAPVQPTSFSMNWTITNIFELFITNFSPLFLAAVGLAIFYQTIVELVVWQSEIHNQLRFLVQFRYLCEKLKHQRISFRYNKEYRATRPLVISLANLILAKVQDEIKTVNSWTIYLMRANLIGYDRSRSSIGFQPGPPIAFQRLSLWAINLIQSVGNNEVDLDDVSALLGEKIYVNFCLYLKQFNDNAPSMAAINSHSYALFSGVILISIWYCLTTHNDQQRAIVPVIFFVGIYTNAILLANSSVYAKGKTLHKTLWSLIFQQVDAKDGHLVELWFKQVRFLDSQDGIALKALGFRVTHVRILQLVVWAATMIAFILQLTN